MNNPNPELVILPFTAKTKLTDIHLSFDQLMFLLNKGHRHSIQIERSYPGAPHTIGWTIALSAGDLASFVDIPVPVVKSLLRRLSEQDVRLLRAMETRDKADVTYEIFHDVLAAPILDWRERWQYRYKLRRRSSIVALAILLVIVYITIIFLGMQNYIFEALNDPVGNLTCVLPLLCLAGVFGIVGFVTVVNWARTR